MPTSTLPDLTSYLYNPAAYGSKPNIPATSTNTSEQTSGWTTSLPNYASLAGTASGNIENQLSGQLNPQDLANAQTWAAERGVSTGVGANSPNGLAAYQQFLGLSSQQLEQQGQQNLNASLAAAPRTTTTSGSQTTDNNVLRAMSEAAPDPTSAALANLGAQQLGLGAGAGAGGGGVSQHGNPAISTAGIQQPSAALGGTGPFTGGGTNTFDSGQSGQAQNTSQGVGTITMAGGSEWLNMGDGTYMDIMSGRIQEGDPSQGSMPDYSQAGGGYDPIAQALGLGQADPSEEEALWYGSPSGPVSPEEEEALWWGE